MWDLSSLTRGGTHTPCGGRTVSFFFFFFNTYFAVPGLNGGTRDLPSLWVCRIFTCGMWDPFPDQGSNPSPRLWKLRVLTTGLPWKSLGIFVFEGLYGFAHARCSVSPYPGPAVFLPLVLSYLAGGGLVTQSCLTLCNPMDCSPPGSSVHGFPRQEYWSGLSCPPPGGSF